MAFEIVFSFTHIPGEEVENTLLFQFLFIGENIKIIMITLQNPKKCLKKPKKTHKIARKPDRKPGEKTTKSWENQCFIQIG